MTAGNCNTDDELRDLMRRGYVPLEIGEELLVRRMDSERLLVLARDAQDAFEDSGYCRICDHHTHTKDCSVRSVRIVLGLPDKTETETECGNCGGIAVCTTCFTCINSMCWDCKDPDDEADQCFKCAFPDDTEEDDDGQD